MPEKVALYFTDDFDFENEEAVSVLKEETVPLVMKALIEGFHSLDELNHDSVKGVFKAVQKGNKLKGQQVYMPFRVALTGNQHGPELAEMVPLLGLERTEARIRASLVKAGITL